MALYQDLSPTSIEERLYSIGRLKKKGLQRANAEPSLSSELTGIPSRSRSFDPTIIFKFIFPSYFEVGSIRKKGEPTTALSFAWIIKS